MPLTPYSGGMVDPMFYILSCRRFIRSDIAIEYCSDQSGFDGAVDVNPYQEHTRLVAH